VTTYLIKRGKRAVQRIAKAHLARYDARGEIAGPFCHRSGFDVSSNVPWGLAICRDCLRKWRAT
jgi:hypothetical protein